MVFWIDAKATGGQENHPSHRVMTRAHTAAFSERQRLLPQWWLVRTDGCVFSIVHNISAQKENVPVQSFWFYVKVQDTLLSTGLLGTESWSTWICPAPTRLKKSQRKQTSHFSNTVCCLLNNSNSLKDGQVVKHCTLEIPEKHDPFNNVHTKISC